MKIMIFGMTSVQLSRPDWRHQPKTIKKKQIINYKGCFKGNIYVYTDICHTSGPGILCYRCLWGVKQMSYNYKKWIVEKGITNIHTTGIIYTRSVSGHPLKHNYSITISLVTTSGKCSVPNSNNCDHLQYKQEPLHKAKFGMQRRSTCRTKKAILFFFFNGYA